jgi:hypothetical protein
MNGKVDAHGSHWCLGSRVVSTLFVTIPPFRPEWTDHRILHRRQIGGAFFRENPLNDSALTCTNHASR